MNAEHGHEASICSRQAGPVESQGLGPQVDTNDKRKNNVHKRTFTEINIYIPTKNAPQEGNHLLKSL